MLVNVQRKPTGHALIQLSILLCLYVWAFLHEIKGVISSAISSSEMVYTLLLPVIIACLIYLRRDSFAKCSFKSSVFGLVLIVSGLIIYAISTWPFSFGYARNMAMILILAGIILSTCGWKVLALSFSSLFLFFLAMPIPWSLYSRLAIWPETYSLAISSKILQLLPNTRVWLNGNDILFSAKTHGGGVAIGDAYKGIRLLYVFAVIAIFVIFSKNRTLTRFFMSMLFIIPLVFLCNIFRIVFWGLLVIIWQIEAISIMPRYLSAIISMSLMYLLSVLICAVKINLFVEEDYTEAISS